MKRNIVFCIFLLPLLTGCATTNNPREGGFFGGVAGLSSGAYDERLKHRKYDLAQQQSVNQDLTHESKRLNSYNRKLGKEVASLTEMDKKLSDLQKEINNLKAKSNKQKDDIDTLAQRIKSVRQKIKTQQGALEELERAGGSTTNPDRYRVLKLERNRLADEYEKLINYSKVLHDAAK